MDDITGLDYLIIEWVLACLCIVLVGTRLAVRIWMRASNFWLSDIFLVIAVLIFVTYAGGDIVETSNLDSQLADFSSALNAEWTFAVYILFYTGYYFPRFSLLAFYHELFPASERRARISLYVVMGYTFLCFLSAILLSFLGCGLDVENSWRPASEQSPCTLQTNTTVTFINWGVGFSSELLIFFLPFQLFHLIKALPKREKIGLIAIFMLGIITLLVGCVRIICDIYISGTWIDWSIENAEFAVQILVVTMPALRPLLGAMQKRVKGPSEEAGPQKDPVPLSSSAATDEG